MSKFINSSFFAVIEILMGLASIVLHRRFAVMTNHHQRSLLRKKYNDEHVLRIVFLVAGIVLMALGFSQLLR